MQRRESESMMNLEPKENSSSSTTRDIYRFRETRVAAEGAQAQSQLSNANKQLSAMIQESNSNGNNNSIEDEDEDEDEDDQYEAVMRELAHIKQELSKLKMDMASILQHKSEAVKQAQHSRSKILSYSSRAEALDKEMEEANEEQVLLELARIEALKERGAIEAHKEKEAEEFSMALETTRKKMNELMEEIDQSRELETKLAMTISEVGVLQNEVKLVKKNEKHLDLDLDLEAAKKELASIKQEGFQFMTSMDIIRNELLHVTQEMSRLNKKADKADLTVQSLNSKLLRAKAKLESASTAEEKAKSIAHSLSLTLEQLKAEAKLSQKQNALVAQEIAIINQEIQKTGAEIDSAEGRLEASMKELEGVKLSEAMALESLKSLIENTMRARASASEKLSSFITISKFEYEYLTGRATGAEEIADKKVAAAQAWIEALKASEKEMHMKIEIAQRQIRGKVMEMKESGNMRTKLGRSLPMWEHQHP